MKKVQLILAFCAIAMISFASDPGEITVKSSVVCDMCKEKIEEGLAFEKGVKKVRVDVEANTVYVKFSEKHLTEDQVKNLISNLGYRADEMPANKKSFDQLAACCQSKDACEERK